MQECNSSQHYRSSRLEVFYKKGVLKNFTKVTGKHPCRSLFLIKIQTSNLQYLLKKRLRHRYSLENFAKLLRTPFSENTSSDCFWLCLNYKSLQQMLLHLDKNRLSFLNLVEFSVQFQYHLMLCQTTYSWLFYRWYHLQKKRHKGWWYGILKNGKTNGIANWKKLCERYNSNTLEIITQLERIHILYFNLDCINLSDGFQTFKPRIFSSNLLFVSQELFSNDCKKVCDIDIFGNFRNLVAKHLFKYA